MGTTAVLLQAGLTAAMLGVLVLAGRLADALLSGDPRLPRPGHQTVALDDQTEGSDMTMECHTRQLMADRMREAANYRRGAPQSLYGRRHAALRRHGRRRGALRRRVGYGLLRAGLRLVDAPVPSLTREGARP
ncbi:MAG: hypothetical protein ACRDMV_03085 [Streptosporangiales bacterium]